MLKKKTKNFVLNAVTGHKRNKTTSFTNIIIFSRIYR